MLHILPDLLYPPGKYVSPDDMVSGEAEFWAACML